MSRLDQAAVDTDVVVVGAGPVGLLLAGELRLGGARVTVLEQRATPTTESRASTLHARTMEIFDSRGLLDALGAAPRDPRGHFGGVPLDLELPSRYPGQWKVPQTRTEALLEAWARRLGTDVRRGHRVHAVTVSAGHVEAEAVGPAGEARVRGRYLVGCDGEDSTVRALVAADFPGTDASRYLLRADVAGLDLRERRFERLERGLAIAARRPDGVTRVMVHEFGGGNGAAAGGTAGPDFARVRDAWLRVTGEDIGLGRPLWVNAFGDANRQLARYRHGRVLFAGDAAHRQMPAGGQALNLGLQDAFNLGWKLAAEVAGTAPAGLVDSYHTERHAVGRRVLANIRAQASLLLGGAEVEPLRQLLGELIALEPARAHLAAMICGLDVRYDVGPGGHPLLGAPLPHARIALAPGEGTTTELLRAGRGVLLDLRGGVARSLAAPWPWSERVAVTSARLLDAGIPGAATDAWGSGGSATSSGAGSPDGPGGPNGSGPPGDASVTGLSGVDAVLVRPDGHVVWAAPGRDPLPEALRRWFGPPARSPDRSRVAR